MDILQLRDALYRKIAVSTAVFAVLCVILLVVYDRNVTFFESHGKIGTLAESEQQKVEMENSKKLYSKKHIAVQITDENSGELQIPLEENVSESQISIREEFLSNKIVISLAGENQIIANHANVISDSNYMNAISLYRQKEDTVIELFCNDVYSYTYGIEEGHFYIRFQDLKQSFDTTCLVYVPFSMKDHFALEDWNKELNVIAQKYQCKLFVCPQMQENYTQKAVLDFVNKHRIDYIMAVDVNTNASQNGIHIICNPEYFIPDFHSVDLGVLMGENISHKVGIAITEVLSCKQDDELILQASMPAAGVMVEVTPPTVQSIEEEYSFYHGIMEGIKSALTELLEKKKR